MFPLFSPPFILPPEPSSLPSEEAVGSRFYNPAIIHIARLQDVRLWPDRSGSDQSASHEELLDQHYLHGDRQMVHPIPCQIFYTKCLASSKLFPRATSQIVLFNIWSGFYLHPLEEKDLKTIIGGHQEAPPLRQSSTMGCPPQGKACTRF